MFLELKKFLFLYERNNFCSYVLKSFLVILTVVINKQILIQIISHNMDIATPLLIR